MAVTLVAGLTEGTAAKVNGTMEAYQRDVLWKVPVGDTSEWDGIPFNVTDETGTVRVFVYGVKDTRCCEKVQSGRHDGDWWTGDSVSVIGDVQRHFDGSIVVIARYVAQTPTSFYRPWESTVPILAFAVGSTAYATYAFASYRHRSALHRERVAGFPAKVLGGRPCPVCGILLASGVRECRNCGWAEPLPRPILDDERMGALTRLPALRMRTAFTNLSRTYKAVLIGISVGFPATVLVMGYWFLTTMSPFWGVEPSALVCGAPILLAILGAFAFLRLSSRMTLLLGPERIELQYGIGRSSVPTPEVDRILMLHGRAGDTLTVVSRAGKSVHFGPGLAAMDYDRARRFLQGLSEILGVEVRDIRSPAEAIAYLQGRLR